jgi:phospho-N-acetylmuramoyl-pentapeptide-transferase
MLYYLLFPLREYVSAFNVFRYITFRAAYAAVTAILLSFFLGPLIIRKLKVWGLKESFRAEGPSSHKSKEGTPSMGGIIILISVLVPTLLWAQLDNPCVILVIFASVWMGLFGFLDDYMKNVRKLPRGLIGRYKLGGQILLGIVTGIFMKNYFQGTVSPTAIGIPFIKNLFIDLGIFYIPFVILVITGTSNSVNLTDGLDGLAIGLVGIATIAMAGFCYVSGHVKFAEYLNILYVYDSAELTVFCFALMGAAMGFLYYNCHPAQVFMGDTGSLPIGGALGTMAVLIKKELLLFIVGGVFVMETLSVIIQVFHYRRTGRRVFRMAPLHHHYELLGWPESRVVVRFWIAGILCMLISLSTLKLQ